MKTSNPKLRKHIARLSLGLVLSLSNLSASTPVNPDWKEAAKQLIDTPLNVSYNNAGRQSQIQLINLKDKLLTFRVNGQDGEASMPLNTIGDVVFQYKTTPGFLKALGKADEETFNILELEAIRKTAYPMAKFVNIPEKHANFLSIVLTLYQGLIQLDQWDEALFLAKEIKAPNLGLKYEETTLQLAKIFLENNSLGKAIEVIEIVDVEKINSSNAGLVFDLAHILREQENFGDAIRVYKQLAINKGITDHEAEFWAYYCELKQGKYIDDLNFVEDVRKIDAGDPGFPLQQLVFGTYFSEREKHEDAMRSISEGIAYATPVEEWTPELMYRSALTYQNIDMIDISQAVLEETILFFPQSHWAEAAKKTLETRLYK